MANKFTKSVLERQAKEQKEKRPEPEPLVAAPEPVTAEAAPVVAPAPKPRKVAAAAPIPDLTAFFIHEEARAAKNKTFYLDAAVIEALHRAATAQKVTDSKLVNEILKKILGVQM